MYMNDVTNNDYWTAAGEVATFVISILVAVVVYHRVPGSSVFLSLGAALVSLAVVFVVLHSVVHHGYSVDGEREDL